MNGIVQMEKGKTMSEWIPVSEKVPNESCPVLLYGNGKTTVGFQDDVMAVGTLERSKSGSEYFVDHLYLSFHPTHWMPLPNPPKEKDNE